MNKVFGGEREKRKENEEKKKEKKQKQKKKVFEGKRLIINCFFFFKINNRFTRMGTKEKNVMHMM